MASTVIFVAKELGLSMTKGFEHFQVSSDAFLTQE